MNCNVHKYFDKVIKRMETSTTYEENGDRGVRYCFQDQLIINYGGQKEYVVFFKEERVFIVSEKEWPKHYKEIQDTLVNRRMADRAKILEQL